MSSDFNTFFLNKDMESILYIYCEIDGFRMHKNDTMRLFECIWYTWNIKMQKNQYIELLLARCSFSCVQNNSFVLPSLIAFAKSTDPGSIRNCTQMIVTAKIGWLMDSNTSSKHPFLDKLENLRVDLHFPVSFPFI